MLFSYPYSSIVLLNGAYRIVVDNELTRIFGQKTHLLDNSNVNIYIYSPGTAKVIIYVLQTTKGSRKLALPSLSKIILQ